MNFESLFKTNFLEYASYVIKDRAIPTLEDGLKPVQRRILHSLFEMHDSSYHKVANVVGHCMKYHPHGDASIYAALVNLANKDILIDKQGNFGNILTGDSASAARYIECRLDPIAFRILHNPEITQYEKSYDGRNKEPLLFRSKIPLVLIQGAEGIAVGMSTKILPHNFGEVIQGMQSAIKGEDFNLYPDFPTGGVLDISNYEEGNGKVISRAKLDIEDPKRIIIKELPFGVTTESLVNSIDQAVKKGKLKLLSIQDYSGEKVEIELKLPRGIQASEVLPSLYAYTETQVSLSLNLLVISESFPRVMSAKEIIREYSSFLQQILKEELDLSRLKLEREIYLKTLEQLFIEEGIYKVLEEVKQEKNLRDILSEAFIPYHTFLKKEPSLEDLTLLLNIPIRRISGFDRSKNEKDVKALKASLKLVIYNLKNLQEYSLDFLDSLLKDYPQLSQRKTELANLESISQKDIAQRNLSLFYNKETGYLGTDVEGELVQTVSEFDRILIIDKKLNYNFIKVPNKLFTGEILYTGLAEKEFLENIIFSLIYKIDNFFYLKRFKLDKFILGKTYNDLLPEKAKYLSLAVNAKGLSFDLDKSLKGLTKINLESLESFLIKGKSASGKRLSDKPIKKVKWAY